MTAAPSGVGIKTANISPGPNLQKSRNNIFASKYSDSTGSREHGTNMSSYSSQGRVLNISDEKLANIKSPMFLKLESMIQTLDKFRTEMDGSRVPKFEVAFIEKRKQD